MAKSIDAIRYQSSVKTLMVSTTISRKILGTVLSLFILPEAFSTSFDCLSARSSVESLICTDARLSTLDAQLNKSFKTAIEKAKEKNLLVREQLDWLNTNRNLCSTVSCLTSAYSSRIAELDQKSAHMSSCPIEERSILGEWQAFDTASEFEEMSFQVANGSRAFLSRRNHNPEMSGRWELRDCEIRIFDPNVTPLAFDFKVKKYLDDTLYLEEVKSGGSISIYKKMKQAKGLR